MTGPKCTLVLQRTSSTTDNMGGFTTSLKNMKIIKGVLASSRGNKTRIRDKFVVEVTHIFYMDLPSDLIPNERDQFQTEDGLKTFDVLYVDQPALKFNFLKLDLKQVELGAI